MADTQSIVNALLAARTQDVLRKNALTFKDNLGIPKADVADIAMSSPRNDVLMPGTATTALEHLGLMKKPSASGSGSGSSGPQTIVAQMLSAGETSQKIAKAVKQFEDARDRVNTGKQPSKSLASRAKDLTNRGIVDVGSGLVKALDLVARPGYAATAGVKGILEGSDQSTTGSGIGDIGINAWRGLSGKDKSGGVGILQAGGWQPTHNAANNIARSLLGFGLDVGLDPTSYIGLGAVSAGKDLGEHLTQQGLSSAVKRATAETAKKITSAPKGGALRGTRKLAEAELNDIAQAGVNAHRSEELRLFQQAQKYPKLGALSEMKTAHDAELALSNDPVKAMKAAYDSLNATSNVVRDSILTAARDYGRGRFAFRAGWMGRGPDLLENTKLGQRLYRPFEVTAERLGKTKAGDMIANAFKYERQFPGQAAYLRSKASSAGVLYHDMLRDKVRELFQGVPVEVRKEMSHAIESGTPMANPMHEMIRQKVIQLFKEMGADEVALGIRSPNELLNGDKYVPHIYRRYARRQAANEPILKGGLSFRRLRQDTVRNSVFGDIPGATLKDAAARGLKPEEDLAKIILAKGAKVNRGVVRSHFYTDMALTYGQAFKTSTGLKDASKWGVAEVPQKFIPPNVAKALKLGKDIKLYMPHEYIDAMQHLDKIMTFGTDEETTRAFLRYMDNVNKVFKYSKTIARPSYHMNNMMSDMMFGWFDNTPLRNYSENMARYLASKSGLPVKGFQLGDHHAVTWDEMVHAYRTHAGGSNFFSTELPLNVTGSNAFSRANQGAHTFSQKREDFARFTHFESAVKDEFKRLAKGKGPMPKYQFDKTFEEAVKNATRRVNKFNIDYNALTEFEQHYMRRIIPFYTYMRKATPMILQSAMWTPGKVTMLDKQRRLVENLLGVQHNQEFDNIRFPDWMRWGGYAQLNNAQEPTVWDLSNLPQGLLAQRFGATNVNDAFKNQVKDVNLGIRGPFEIATGKNLFTGKKIDSPISYLMGEFNPLTNFMPGARGSRLKRLAGLPISKVTEQQQLAAIASATDPLNQQVKSLNTVLQGAGYDMSRVNTKNGTKYRITDRLTGKIVGDYNTAQQAQQVANRLGG